MKLNSNPTIAGTLVGHMNEFDGHFYELKKEDITVHT